MSGPSRNTDDEVTGKMTTRWAIIGATGRLGRALCEQLSGQTIAGLARHEPPSPLSFERFITDDCQEPTALSEVLRDAEIVFHLCAFGREDALALAAAIAVQPRAPRLVVLASSLAERPPERWQTPEDEIGQDAALEDGYGLGKQAARLTLESEVDAPVLSLLLPQLVCDDDLEAREIDYLRDAQDLGFARVAGDGSQRPALTTTAAVAASIVALCALPAPPAGPLHVAPRRGPTVAQLVESLLGGADLPRRWKPHPDPAWRGPHSGANEEVNTGRLHSLLPHWRWPDPLPTCASLGALLRGHHAGTLRGSICDSDEPA